MKVNHGIIALNLEGKVVHFCGYEFEPTKEDWALLEEELKTDVELGLTEITFGLATAPRAFVDYYGKEIQDATKHS